MILPKQKVVFVLPALTAGGAERVMITLMNGLDRTVFEPMFVTVSTQGPLRSLIREDIPFHALGGAGRVGRSLPRLHRKLKEINPDIVVSTMAHMNFAMLLLKPFFPRTRFVVREAITPSFILQDRGLAAPLLRFLYRWLYPKADLVISPAQIIVDEFKTVLGMETGNHMILPNPVDSLLSSCHSRQGSDATAERESGETCTAQSAGFFMPDPRSSFRIRHHCGGDDRCVYFIAAGRLHSQKGFDRLIEALPRLPPDIEWSLAILGEGPERGRLEKLIEKYDLKNRVSLPGLIDKPWPHYAEADAFLLPSRWEGLPNVVLESLACGTPVIAMKEAGGIQEIAALAPPGAVMVAKTMDEFIAVMKAMRKKRDAQSLLPDTYRLEAVVSRFSALLLNAPPG